MNSHDEIEDELKQVAPYVASIPRSHPFTVPSTYFEEMEMKLVSVTRNEDHKEIRDYPNDHPFTVPEDYFNTLPSNILSTVSMSRDEEIQERKIRTTSATTKKISSYKLWLVAASIAALVVVSATLFMKHDLTENTFASTTTESVASDLMYASEVDEAMVVELYLQDQQQNVEQNNFSGDFNEDNNFLRDVTDIDPYLIYEM